MVRLALIVGVLAATAHADTSASVYTPAGMLLVRLDDGGKLASLVGAAKKGVVRCYVAADNVQGSAGAGEVGIEGCFVGIKRDGKLVAPPATNKRWDMSHLAPDLDGSLMVEPARRRTRFSSRSAAPAET